MFDGFLMLWENLFIVDLIYLKGIKFVIGVNINIVVDLKFNDSFV